MQETKIYCDICKKEVKEIVKVKIEPDYPYIGGYSSKNSFTSKSYELCKECAERIGIVKRKDFRDDGTIKQEDTTAEKLYNIIVDLVNENSQP